MKILHINRNYIGTALHHLLIEQLDAEGLTNDVFVPVSVTAKADRPYITDRVTVQRCFRKRDRYFFHLKQFKIYRALERNMDIGQYDIIHAHTLFTDGYSAYRISKKYGIPYVAAVRDTDVNAFFKKQPWMRKLGQRILQRASYIIFLSKTYCDEVMENYIPARLRPELMKKVSVVPNGIDRFWHDNEYRNQRTPDNASGALRIICVGRICKRKNIPVIQAALGILRKEGTDASLTVVGKIDEEDEYKKIMEDPNTVYHEPVQKEKLVSFYREADIFVLPSLTETFGLVYAEAMSQGLPVVYSKGQGFDGQFPEGAAGYHVDSGSPEEVAQAIFKIRDQYAEIAGRVTELSRVFDWEKIAKKYAEIYSDCKIKR